MSAQKQSFQCLLYVLLCPFYGFLFCPIAYSNAKPLVIENESLTVRFEYSDIGPRLAGIDYKPASDSYIFSDSQEVSLVALRPEVIHDPDLKVSYELQKDFRFVSAVVAEDKKSVVFHFLHNLFKAEVSYELLLDSPVLHKTITCTAHKEGAYVAGVRQWMLKPANMDLSWPKVNTYSNGQPAVFLKASSGCLFTLEWPNASLVFDNSILDMQYRPGFLLESDQSKEVSTGSIVFFEKQANKKETDLEAARQAFFQHITEIVKPNIPFPIKFTTWGPWMTFAHADRIFQVMDDLEYVGTDLLHLDAGWQWPDRPYSTRMPLVRDANDRKWDLAMTQPERFPDGVLPVIEKAKLHGMKLSVWMDSLSTRYIREGDQWTIRDRNGAPVYGGVMAEGRFPEDKGKIAVQSLASEYGHRLKEFVLQTLERYDLGGMMFDFHSYMPDYSKNHESMTNGWDSIDVQLRRMMEIYDAAENRRHGIYKFYCKATSWPWALKHVTHIHAKDPGSTGDMEEAIKTDHPARALAYERRLAWQDHYDNFVPPWGIKGDIAGWSIQQNSPIPVNLEHTGQLIPSGEGWTQNMFTCFATSAVRDVRFSFAQMPQFDKDILKEWLAWDRQRTKYIFNCRPLFRPNTQPNEGIMGYSHVGNGQGVIYLFNSSFELVQAKVKLDEDAGFRPCDSKLSAYVVYPVKVPLGTGTLSYGDTVAIPIIGKDCVVIEVGLDKPQNLIAYPAYKKLAKSVRRSFKPIYLASFGEIVNVAKDGNVKLEVGDSPRDKRLAKQIIETIGAAVGRRISLEDCDIPLESASCILIIGTNEGLSNHKKTGAKFCRRLYNQYIEWDDLLISAPLVAKLSDAEKPVYCLVAPRPEQLAQLAKIIVADILADSEEYVSANHSQEFKSAISAKSKSILRFRPLIACRSRKPLAENNLDYIRFEINAEYDGKRELLWSENIPPIYGEPWWGDRVISVADLAGKNVKFYLSSRFLDGREDIEMTIGFKNIGLIEKK